MVDLMRGGEIRIRSRAEGTLESDRGDPLHIAPERKAARNSAAALGDVRHRLEHEV